MEERGEGKRKEREVREERVSEQEEDNTHKTKNHDSLV